MSLTAKEPEQRFDPIPEGVHIAVCYGIFDLGTHYQERWEKDSHRVLICWEIPSERIEVERDGKMVDLPQAISQKYTLSLGALANLRRDLEAWRGKKFTPEELDGFDLRKVIGSACQLQVLHNYSEAKRKTYANPGTIMALPKDTVAPKPENELQWFSFEEGFDIPDNTPDWVVEIIKQSKEWDQYTGKDMPVEEPEPVADPSGVVKAEEEDDRLPF